MDDLKLPAQEWLGYDPERGDLHGYTSEQMRTALAAEREQCAATCDALVAQFGGVVSGRMATEHGKLIHEAMAAGAMNCAAAIRSPDAPEGFTL